MTALLEPVTVPLDEPAEEAERYGVYTLDTCGDCLGKGSPNGLARLPLCGRCHGIGRAPVLLATCTKDGLGVAVVAQADDREEAGLDPAVYGILDRLERRWIASLWHPRA